MGRERGSNPTSSPARPSSTSNDATGSCPRRSRSGSQVGLRTSIRESISRRIQVAGYRRRRGSRSRRREVLKVVRAGIGVELEGSIVRRHPGGAEVDSEAAVPEDRVAPDRVLDGSAPATSTPSPPFMAMTFAEAVPTPPMRVLRVPYPPPSSSLIPAPAFGTAEVPVMSVPMRFPSIVFPTPSRPTRRG